MENKRIVFTVRLFFILFLPGKTACFLTGKTAENRTVS